MLRVVFFCHQVTLKKTMSPVHGVRDVVEYECEVEDLTDNEGNGLVCFMVAVRLVFYCVVVGGVQSRHALCMDGDVVQNALRSVGR